MRDGRFRLTLAVVAVLVGISQAESKNVAAQSPRQALVEMFSGDEAQFKRHLTVEMQHKLRAMSGDTAAAVPLQAFTAAKTGDPERFQAFDLGPILFSFNNPEQHERYEVKIDNESLRGEEDALELSLHYLRNGIEQQTPFALRFVLNMKRQEATWRLNAVTLSATLPVGDPRILDQSGWGPAALLANAGAAADTSQPVVVDERPKLSALRAVRMIGMAENIYAQGHPGIGYTCKLADLVNVGKGLDEDGVYRFMDAAFAGGLYNGYHFTLSGCEHRPARTFHVMAEPVDGKGKAYCSDHTNNLRASDDGRGATCLISGKLARK